MTRQTSKPQPVKKSSTKKAVSPLLQGFVWGGCFTLTAAISGFIGMTVALKGPLPFDIIPFMEKVRGAKSFNFASFIAPPIENSLNILILGVDRVSDNQNNDTKFWGRSDTMLLIRLDTEGKFVRVLSIPRDTRIRFPNGNYGKINSANAMGGIPFTETVIANNFYGVSIDKYVRVTNEALAKIIDGVGGVEVNVPMDMEYTDRTQGLYINLKQGKQTLNGNQAEQFVRFRNDTLGDIGRVQRQQMLLKALKEKLRSPQVVFKIPKLLRILESEIDTDLTRGEILSLISFSLGLEKDNIQMLMMPGRASNPTEYQLSYWLIPEESKRRVIKEYLQEGYLTPRENISPANVRIVIQNGTDNPEISQRLATILRKNGYKNVQVSSNATIATPITQIIVQKGDKNTAEEINKTLKFGKLEYSSTGDIYSDITIRLGNDALKIIKP